MRNASLEDSQLLAESEILQRDLFVAAKDQKDHPKKREDCVQHEAGSVSASSLKINRLRDRWDLARRNRRIQGALANVGHVVARTTIADILKRHGIEPAPERSRKTTWKDFLKRHWDQIVATDFFTVEVWTPTGLQRLIVLFFMDLSTRRVELGGIARSPNGFWMSQIARNLTDAVDGFFMGKRFLIHDRDPLYTTEFLDILAGVGVQSVKLPPRSPNLNAHAERFVRTIKEGCLDQMIFFGEDSLRLAIHHFILHYHLERNHQAWQPAHRSNWSCR